MWDRATWIRWLPGLQTLRNYEAWLRNDIVAGIVLATMLVPVGIAYAVASGVPGIYGLYATIVPLLAYALFGPSRILVLGPDSSLAAVILGVVLPLSGGDPMRAIALASAMALVSGTVCILAGVFRLGFITELLSKPIRYGYMNGIALTVLISQLPKLFGFSIESTGPVRDVWAIGQAILADRTNWSALAVGVGTLAVILLLKAVQAHPGHPGRGHRRDFRRRMARSRADRRRVKVLGPVPQGLPDFILPWIGPNDIVPVLLGGIAVAIVSFADTSVLSRVYAARTGIRVDPNQEMVGLGAANLAAGFFQGFPISSSSSRTPVAEAAGARTQLTGVVGALVVALLLIAAPLLFRNLPTTALAAVVIAAAIGLFEFTDLRRIYRIQQWEFWLSIVCTVGVAVFGAIPGHRPGDRHRRHRIPVGWLATAFGGARQGRGRQRLSRHHPISRGAPDTRPGPVPLGRAPVLRQRRIVLRSRSGCGRDVADPGAAGGGGGGAGHQRRCHLVGHPRRAGRSPARAGIELCFAEMKDPVKDKLKRFGLFAQLGQEFFFPTLGSAVSTYLATQPAEWVDWEDRSP